MWRFQTTKNLKQIEENPTMNITSEETQNKTNNTEIQADLTSTRNLGRKQVPAYFKDYKTFKLDLTNNK